MTIRPFFKVSALEVHNLLAWLRLIHRLKKFGLGELFGRLHLRKPFLAWYIHFHGRQEFVGWKSRAQNMA